MKTAVEIIIEIGLLNESAFTESLVHKSTISVSEAIRMINQSREEAIRECGELCADYEDGLGEHRNSILNLIKELK